MEYFDQITYGLHYSEDEHAVDSATEVQMFWFLNGRPQWSQKVEIEVADVGIPI